MHKPANLHKPGWPAFVQIAQNRGNDTPVSIKLLITSFFVFCAKCTKIPENTPVFSKFFVQSAQLSGK